MEIDRENFDDSLLSGLLWFPENVISMDSWYCECEKVLELYGIELCTVLVFFFRC